MDREFYKKLVSHLKINSQYGSNEDDDMDLAYDMEDQFNKLDKKYSFAVATGVTKTVFICEQLDMVVKIPYNGRYYTPEAPWSDELNDYDWEAIEDMENFEEFSCANDLGVEDARPWDYCENELIKYEIAVENGYKKFFPKTEFLCEVDFHPIYIQEKVTPYDSCDFSTFSPSEEGSKKAQNSKYQHIAPTDWVAKVFDEFDTIEEAEDFFRFLDDNLMDRDLHSGNVGYKEDGTPVLLDFSGYREDW